MSARSSVLACVLALSSAAAGGQSSTPTARATDSVESIYVVRSWRESRVPPTAFCRDPRVGFARATVEDRYTFRSVASQADGTLDDTDVRVVGQLHACFAMPADSGPIAFYG